MRLAEKNILAVNVKAACNFVEGQTIHVSRNGRDFFEVGKIAKVEQTKNPGIKDLTIACKIGFEEKVFSVFNGNDKYILKVNMNEAL